MREITVTMSEELAQAFLRGHWEACNLVHAQVKAQLAIPLTSEEDAGQG